MTTTTSTSTTSTLPTGLRHFQCYEIRPAATFNRAGISLVDEFGTLGVSLNKAKSVCAPASKNAEDPLAVIDPRHLTSYQVRPPQFERVLRQPFVNQFGPLVLDLIKPARLLVPSSKSIDGSPPPPLVAVVDHFTCYKAKQSRGTARFAGQIVDIETQLETEAISIVKPLRLCAPTNKNGEGIDDPTGYLTCYKVRASGSFGTTTVIMLNQFGEQTYQIRQRREFCVPTTRESPYGSPSRAFVAPPADILD